MTPRMTMPRSSSLVLERSSSVNRVARTHDCREAVSVSRTRLLPTWGVSLNWWDPRDPQLTVLRPPPLRFEDVSLSLGLGFKLTIPARNLTAAHIGQLPIASNLIFTDGFESGDTSAWVVSPPASTSPQSPAPESFTVEATGTLDIEERVAIPGNRLTNYFSLIGEGTSASLGFQPTMIFVNTGGQSDLQIEFFDPAGDPLEVTLAGQPMGPAQAAPMTVFNTSLSPGQALSLETVGLENLKVGYARFTAGPSVGATAVFNSSDTPTGVNLYAAGVPAISRPLRRFSLFLDSLGVKDTGLAMVRVGQNRDSALPQGDLDNVTLRLLDTDFQAIATTSFSLSEGAQISRFIREFFQDQPEIAAQAREMQGVLVVESPDLLAAITMRLTNDPANPTLTTFPVIEGRAEPSMMEALRRGREGSQ